ncbi:MAG: sugar ABC transporter permease [Alphaproteobacteria bacterium]|nr:sugar ABC transporter permease [Alphaproteobacteria bacterium]
MDQPDRRREGALARRERRLAYALLMPTFLLVLAVVLLPLLANFWISVKPVTLAELRPPSLILKEQVRGDLAAAGDEARLEYRYRNSSIKYPLEEVVFTDSLPAGVVVTSLDPACVLESDGAALRCELGTLDGKARGKIRIGITAGDGFSGDKASFKAGFKASVPTATFTAYNVMTSFDFTLANFERVFSAAEFWDVLKVSVYYTVFGTAGALLLGLFAAQILQKAFFGRPLIRGLMLFPYVAPVIAVAFSWVVLFDPFSGAVNAMLLQMDVAEGPINFFGQRSVTIDVFGFGLTLPMALTMVILFEVWRYFPLSFLFILARMQSIPSDIYEAAEIDGATPIQQFWFLSLPYIAGILAVLFLLRFIWTFNKFDDIFLLTGGNAGTRTLTVNVYEQAFAISNLGAGAAVAVVIFALLLVFSVIFIRFSPKDAS